MADAYVYGMPDAFFGEVVAAAVRLKRRTPRTWSPEDLIAWCAAALAKFKVPRYVRFVQRVSDDRVRKDSEVQAARGTPSSF